ncbi:MAG: hypothetical protein Q8904_11065 [Bacteroidota bacterium]|nr:hypothetical protein [Bacteroidota bacterium]
MKIIYKFIVLLTSVFFIFSCAEEPFTEGNPNFILSFQRDGRTTAQAGTTFYAIPTGSGEFLTLYDGTKGHVWGEEGATGIDFNKADSLGITYDSIGHHSVSLVATSIGKYGKKISKLAKTVQVNVVDERNSITQFFVNGAAGTITSDNQILFSFPDITTNFTYKPIFKLGSNSTACTVTVDGAVQASGVTVQTFTPSVPLVYTVKSPEGVEKTYSVKVTTYKSSTECKLLKFNLASGLLSNGFGEVGVIDEANKTISLTANYASYLSSVKLVAGYSYASVAKIVNTTYTATKGYSLSNSTTVKVTAEDLKTIGVYNLNLTIQDPVTDFTFDGFVPAPVRIIDIPSKTITIEVSKGTDISKLKARWTGSLGTVSLKYGTKDSIQTNGVNVNDFTTPRKYTFYKGNASTTDLTKLVKGDEYTVTVNLK